MNQENLTYKALLMQDDGGCRLPVDTVYLMEHSRTPELNALAAGPLMIDADYRIWLTGISMEIPMAALPKALYVLFLRHPEGIQRECIGDYHEELRRIYFQLSLRENADKLEDSIADLTDPFSGSLNQKISRINAAFRSRLAPDVAQQFILTGPRGEMKCILAARKAILPEELRF